MLIRLRRTTPGCCHGVPVKSTVHRSTDLAQSAGIGSPVNDLGAGFLTLSANSLRLVVMARALGQGVDVEM